MHDGSIDIPPPADWTHAPCATALAWRAERLATLPQRTATRAWATLAAMSFGTDDLERLAAAKEVDIETQAPDGPAHRTTIWVVVDDDEVFVRSYKGATARWFREAMANPAVAVHVDGRRLTATAIPATDPDSIERTSEGFRAKYRPDPATTSMIEQYHETTLRLEPA